jgi:hypothetical protein
MFPARFPALLTTTTTVGDRDSFPRLPFELEEQQQSENFQEIILGCRPNAERERERRDGIFGAQRGDRVVDGRFAVLAVD